MTQRIAYVTGGMGGIGTAICQRLHREGYQVIAGCGPSRDHAKWVAEQAQAGYEFHASVGNVSEWESTTKAFDRVNRGLLVRALAALGFPMGVLRMSLCSYRWRRQGSAEHLRAVPSNPRRASARDLPSLFGNWQGS